VAAVTVVGRVVLAACALLAVAGGVALTVMVVVYFGGDEYLDQVDHLGENLLLAGPVGLAVYVAGAVRAHPVLRALAGVGAALVGFVGSTIAATIVSLAADPGGPRGNLETGVLGIIWLLAGAFFGWQAVWRRWPSRGGVNSA
jgi:hypothetical protein